MNQNQTKQLDNLIADHFQADIADDGDPQVAAVSASQKLRWANAAAVGFEEIESRLSQLCECVNEEHEHDAVPRYRWKSSMSMEEAGA